MKKNNTYLSDDEIDLGNIIKSLWKEKFIILSISIICGLLGYFYGLLGSQDYNFKTEITLKNPPTQIFEPYNLFNINLIKNNNNINLIKNNNNDNNNNNNNNDVNNIVEQFISDFKLNFLSLDNLENFIEESREFDNFKGYLKSRNISTKQYFSGKKFDFSDQRFGAVKEKNKIIPNKYFINHSKKLDGAIFLNKYVEFIKKKTIVEFKNNLKLTLLDTINNNQEALEIAKKIQLENPIIKNTNQQLVVNEPEALFYKGTKVIAENINYLNKRLIKLENDQFDYNVILQKASTLKKPTSLPLYFALGLMLGLFLSLGIIFFKGILKKN
jgi:LPS O-antigen subunit length determinant protein (WzzB/FepE family)